LDPVGGGVRNPTDAEPDESRFVDLLGPRCADQQSPGAGRQVDDIVAAAERGDEPRCIDSRRGMGMGRGWGWGWG